MKSNLRMIIGVSIVSGCFTLGCDPHHNRIELTQERKPTQSQPEPKAGVEGPKKSESDSEIAIRLKEVNLNGMWIADRCSVISRGGNWDDDTESEAIDYSNQSIITIADQIHTLGITTFVDGRCSKPKFTTHIQGTVQSKQPSKNRTDAVEIQLVNLKRLFEIRDEYYIDIFNGMEYCGKSNWEVNVPQEIPQNVPDCEHPNLPALMAFSTQPIANNKLEIQFDQSQAIRFTKK
ncbi:MAG: hypothetical protein NT027_18705 [Proteobacteria bacterium]|nr:hypothetical protein [Pseudomonadota bacterium]